MAVMPIDRAGTRHPQAEACARCAVRSQSLFGALDEAGLDRIHTRIEGLDMAPDETLYARGGDGSALYTIRTGVVRFERSTARGDRRIVRLAGRGDLIGLEALLQRPHADDAIACTPLQLCRIPRVLLDELGQDEAALTRALMQRWQDALDQSEAWVADLATGPARRRVLRLLLRLTELTEPGQPIWLPRREDIGAMLDMAIESASRFVSQLRREGLLSITGPRSARVDRVALLQAIEAQDRS
ncbi:Crp/Fnr family transcriptional regulator [Leptothrix discophora]|nr:Crp/Fnr family transcriptional regulator [Leptothrix discophora]